MRTTCHPGVYINKAMSKIDFNKLVIGRDISQTIYFSKLGLFDQNPVHRNIKKIILLLDKCGYSIQDSYSYTETT